MLSTTDDLLGHQQLGKVEEILNHIAKFISEEREKRNAEDIEDEISDILNHIVKLTNKSKYRMDSNVFHPLAFMHRFMHHVQHDASLSNARRVAAFDKLWPNLFESLFQLGLALERSKQQLREVPTLLLFPIVIRLNLLDWQEFLNFLARYMAKDIRLGPNVQHCFNVTDICRFRSGIQVLFDHFIGLVPVFDYYVLFPLKNCNALRNFDVNLKACMWYGKGRITGMDPNTPLSHQWWWYRPSVLSHQKK